MAWPALVACAFGLLAPVHGTVVVYTKDIPHTIVDEFNDQPAAFGAKLPDDGLRGLLVRADPPDGCSALAPPPPADNFTENWIILIARYNCTFEVKIRNAQAAGFDCAIVHNVNSSELDTMTTKHPAGIDIPSVFVSDVAGLALAESYLYNYGDYYVMVNGAPFDINTQLLLPFAIVVAICLFIMIGLMIAKCIRDRQHARRRRLPARSLRKIPTCKFSKGDPYDTCAICLDDYVEGDRLRVLPCAHAYHAACIDPWLTQSRRVCPVCKRRVLAAGERRAVSDSDSDDSREPLVQPAAASPTTGGTFAPQRENPFVRAARLVTRARASRHHTPQNEDQPEEENNEGNADIENGQNDDTEVLIQPAEPARERRPWFLSRAARRARAAARAERAMPAPVPAPSPAAALATAPAPALLHAPDHSINTETQSRGEIGVAALPAPQDPPSHIAL